MKYKEGNLVEVLRRKEENYDSWFPAKILAVHDSAYTVRYGLFLTAFGEPVVETINERDVRPCPPPTSGRVQWIVGDIAEVLDVCSWRIGQIMKIPRNDRFVIKLFGTIQLQEHDASNLRVPLSWQNNQWIVPTKILDKSLDEERTAPSEVFGTEYFGLLLVEECFQNFKPCHTNYCSSSFGILLKGRAAIQFRFDKSYCSFSSVGNLDKGPSQGSERKTSNGRRPKKKHLFSSIKIVKRNLDSGCGFSPAGVVGIRDRKRKSGTDMYFKLAKRALPKKVGGSFSKDMAMENFRLKSIRFTVNHYITNHAMNSSSTPLRVTEENNECSVASCSVNEYPVYTTQNHRKYSKNTAFNSIDDAISSSPLEDQKKFQIKSGEQISVDVHKLELQAYRSTIQVLHASGPLSWEQESLLTNLRLSLNISNEEHLLHLRHLLSA